MANWRAARHTFGRLGAELTVSLGNITVDGQA